MKIDGFTNSNLNFQLNQTSSAEKLSPSFAHWLFEKAAETNQQLLTADHELQQLASNKSTNLHQTMLTLEEAKLSFQFLEQIRNRLMVAYQDILREQI